MSGGSGGNTAVAKETQMDSVLKRMANQLDRLNASTNRLEEKLSAVIAVEPPATPGADKCEPGFVPLVSTLDRNVGSIEYEVNKIQGIIDRLEL